MKDTRFYSCYDLFLFGSKIKNIYNFIVKINFLCWKSFSYYLNICIAKANEVEKMVQVCVTHQRSINK